MRSTNFVLPILSLSLLLGCQRSEQTAATPPPADLVLLNGYVYTVDPQQSVAQAVAVKDGKIEAVGSDEDIKAYRGPETREIDLAGRMLLPGLHDVHMHPFGIVEPDVCSFNSKPYSLEDMVPVLQACIEKYHPAPGEWLPVDMWNFSEGNQTSERLPNLRAALDAVSTDNPIILWGNDGHHGAVNSAALARATDSQGQTVGLSKQTLETTFAELSDLVGVDGQGEPNGELNESARKLVGPPPRRDPAKLGPLLPQIGEVLASNGITTIQAASLEPAYLDYLEKFEQSGKMHFHIQVATRLVPADFADPLTGEIDIDAMLKILEANRERFKDSRLVHPVAAKIYADGVLEGNPYADPPTLPNGAVLQNYRQPRFHYDPASGEVQVVGYVDTSSPLCEEARANMERYRDPAAVKAFRAENGFHPAQCKLSNGVMADPEPFIMAYAKRLNDAGFTIHIHAIGDRAVRVAVNALEAVMQPNSGNPLRHTLAHLQLVNPDDQRRIGRLGLYLAWTYTWAVTLPEYDMTVIPFIEDVTGPAGMYDPDSYYYRNFYPVRSLGEDGAINVAGSDAPVDSRSPRPVVNIAVAVFRKIAGQPPFNPGEALDIHQAIAAYTINGARAVHQEDITGSIEVGKEADLAVLDHNIVKLAEAGDDKGIVDTKVDMTLFDGQVVYLRQ